MHLLVLGGTGATGKLVVDHALRAGHTVRALVRSPDKLAPRPNLEIVAGQATDPGDLQGAMTSVDAVIVALGATKGTVMTDATRGLLTAADHAGVKKVVMMSSFAVQRDRLSGPATLLTSMGMGAAIKDKTTAEQLLADSNLDYTIVHATRLGNAPATSPAQTVPDSVKLTLGNSISRAAVATYLLDAATSSTNSRSSVVITG